MVLSPSSGVWEWGVFFCSEATNPKFKWGFFVSVPRLVIRSLGRLEAGQRGRGKPGVARACQQRLQQRKRRNCQAGQAGCASLSVWRRLLLVGGAGNRGGSLTKTRRGRDKQGANSQHLTVPPPVDPPTASCLSPLAAWSLGDWLPTARGRSGIRHGNKEFNRCTRQ